MKRTTKQIVDPVIARRAILPAGSWDWRALQEYAHAHRAAIANAAGAKWAFGRNSIDR